MTNGVLLPFRELAGGVTDGVWGVALSPFATVAGVAEGLGWIFVGVLDTLTGGAFALSPDGMAQLNAAPVLQFPEGHRSYAAYSLERPPAEDAECAAD